MELFVEVLKTALGLHALNVSVTPALATGTACLSILKSFSEEVVPVTFRLAW